MKRKEDPKIILDKLINNSDFIDFICYREDKWLQNSTFEEKIKTIFGSILKAKEEFRKDTIFNSQNF